MTHQTVFRNAASFVASFVLGALSIEAANATSLILNGDFSQVGPVNPVLFSGPGQESGVSAAANWTQLKVVPYAYLTTRDEPIAFGIGRQLHVKTDEGPWPPSSMGNGISQTFPEAGCAVASFSIRVVSGQVTGGLASAKGPFLSFTPFKPTGTFQNFSQVGGNVSGIFFETLSGPGAEYYIRDVQVYPCIYGPLISRLPSLVIPPSKLVSAPSGSPLYAFQDVSAYVAFTSYDSTIASGLRGTTIQITNRGATAIEGPMHILLENMTPGRGLFDADGDFLGSPFVTLSSPLLAPGESTAVTVEYDSSSTAVPQYKVRLVTGLL